MTKFLNNYSYKNAVYEKKLEIQNLSLSKYKTQGLCGKKSKNICLLLIVDDYSTILKEMEPLLERYKNDPLTWVYVNKGHE